jgi:hypothetical protein
MGAHPSGYINYGPDGRMIVIIVGSDRKKPAGPVATPDEAEALIRSMPMGFAERVIRGEESRRTWLKNVPAVGSRPEWLLRESPSPVP